VRPAPDATQMLQAPSVSGYELPAVSVPLPLVRSNDGESRASFSSARPAGGSPITLHHVPALRKCR
jgi:hypothetical protein